MILAPALGTDAALAHQPAERLSVLDRRRVRGQILTPVVQILDPARGLIEAIGMDQGEEDGHHQSARTAHPGGRRQIALENHIDAVTELREVTGEPP